MIRTTTKISNIIRHALVTEKVSQRVWQQSIVVRPYASKKGDGRDRLGDCKPCKEPPCEPPPPHLYPGPSQDPRDICNQDFQPYPRDYDCPVENRMDTLPVREFPFTELNQRRKKRYAAILAIGLAILLSSAYYTYLVESELPPKAKASRKAKRPKIRKKTPLQVDDIPKKVKYLLIGGGTASFAAFRAIKSSDPLAHVLVISSESDFPYMRPPLSKEMWFNSDKVAISSLMFKQWNGSERSLFYEPKDFYVKVKELEKQENGGVSVAQGYTVHRIDVEGHKVVIDENYKIQYDKCLIATGALPKNLDIFRYADPKIQNSVTLFRDIFDFQELYQIVENANTIAVIGGGFLGSELACAMARAKKELRVVQIYRESGNMGKILPEYLSLWTSKKVKNEGVELVPKTEVTGVQLKNEKLYLTMSNDDTIEVDHIIVAVGVQPNTELAEKSNLEVDPEMGGFLVNTELQARTDLYAAGDCACFYDTKLGRRRVEHHDHAIVSGRLAGENMTGASKPYWHQSMFWSDLGPDVGYEAIGIVDSRLPTVGVFAKATEADSPKAVVEATNEADRSKTEEIVSAECKPHIQRDPELKALVKEIQTSNKGQSLDDFGKGVIFYLRDDIVVGIVLWNVFNRMNVARQVLKEDRKYDDLNEVAKLFNIHDE